MNQNIIKETVKNTENTSSNSFSMLKTEKTAFKFERPGRLKSEMQLYLNTMDSLLLFSGNQIKNAIGLLRFGARMSQIWYAAAKDDPYADYILIKVYDSIINLRNQLAVDIQDYEHQLSAISNNAQMPLQPFFSEKPVIKSLWFRTQYGYLGGNLIADFDRLMRIALTAHRVGIILDKPYSILRKEWIDRIIELFKMPFRWENLNITRVDIEANNELAKKAQQLMGKLPDNILNKKLRAPFAPLIDEISSFDPKTSILKEDEKIKEKKESKEISKKKEKISAAEKAKEETEEAEEVKKPETIKKSKKQTNKSKKNL